MKVLQRLTLANLRQNKRRTWVTIIGVMLSSALILAVVGMVTSLQKMMINFAIDEYGNAHEMFQEVPVEALKYIEENQHVTEYYYAEPLSTKQVDAEVLEMYQTYQHEMYKAAYYEKLSALPASATGKYNIFVRYDHPKEYKSIREGIQNTIEAETGVYINTRPNSDLLRYEDMITSDAALTTLYCLAAIVIGIIVVTSVFVIRNSFSISASERARQFGMLSSIGATPRQIRHSIIFEGLAIAAVGIPLGILLGVAAVAILVLVMNWLLSGMTPIPVEFCMPFWIFPVAIILSLVTILLSSLLPAIRTARLAPIEAIRGNQDVKIKAKKLRSSKFVAQTFGIGGVIASKNLKRSRKKYRTTVISLVLSVATFIGLSSFMQYGFAMTGTQYSNENIDLVVQNAEPKFYQELQDKFALHNSAYYISHMQSENAAVVAMEASAFADFAKSVGVNTKDYSRVALFNDQGMTLRDNGTYEIQRTTDLKDGANYTAKIYPETPKRCEHEVPMDDSGRNYYIDVDEACVKEAGAEVRDVELKITKMIDQRPLGLSGYRQPIIIVSTDYYQYDQLKFSTDSMTEFFAAEIDDVPAITDYIDQWLESSKTERAITYSDVKANADQMFRMYLLIAIFLYGFIIVVTLIGVTNIFNTITTNIALRAKEFAMLKSIGMTSHEFNRMVRLESLMYSCKALLIGIPIGLLISYGFYQSFANMVDFGYLVPWSAILISVLAVAILVWFIMRYSVRQVEKQNIIETIRSENI